MEINDAVFLIEESNQTATNILFCEIIKTRLSAKKCNGFINMSVFKLIARNNDCWLFLCILRNYRSWSHTRVVHILESCHRECRSKHLSSFSSYVIRCYSGAVFSANLHQIFNPTRCTTIIDVLIYVCWYFTGNFLIKTQENWQR